MATEPGPFQDSGNPKEIQTQDFGSLVLRVEKVGVTAPTVKPDPFAVYQVSLRINVADPPILNGLHWDIWRRFSEFAELHAEFGKPKLQVKFPPKTLWRKLSGEFLEERRQLLDQYLQALAGEPDRRNNESFREFIYPRKPVAGDQPALAGDRTTEDTDPAPVAKKSGDESLKPGSSGAQGHTPMSSAAAAVSVSDNNSYLAPGPISPFDPATPSSTKSQKEPPDPTCTNMSTLPPPSRLNFPRAPVIHASVCSSMRNCWQVGTAVDVYSNSTKSWRPGRVFAIGKTSGYPRSAQEDALTICYGDNRRSRKILPRSSLELRAARQDFLDDRSEEMDEKVNPEPASMATTTWSETVKSAREVLSQVNALEDQSRTPPPETETRTSAFQVGERVRFLDNQSPRGDNVHEGILLRNIGDVWRIAWATDSNKSKWVEEENIRKLRDTEKTLMLEGRTEGQRPKPALPKVIQQPGAAGNIPENMAVAMDNPQPGEDTTHPNIALLTSKDTATERRTPKPTQAPAPTKRPSAPTRTASVPMVAPAIREDSSRRKSKPKWMRWFSKKLDESNTLNKSSKKNPSRPQRTDQDLERKSQERATPSETFTVTNQLESLPNTPKGGTPKGAKETPPDGKIQVLDKLRVEIPGRAKQRKAKTKKKKSQRRRLDAHSDVDEPLPDRLPPDHTVNVLDPNTQRRLSRIRHHLVIKARRHSPA